MKTTGKFLTTVLALILFYGCSGDDDNSIPELINEEELITSVILTLTDTAGNQVVFSSRDLDGDGPNPPQVTVVGNLMNNTTYNGSVQVLNELESPAEDITLEVADEDDEHQFFYTVSNGLGINFAYADQDDDGNPVGIATTATTTATGSGTLTVTLIHLPNKTAAGVAQGNITNAGGETDAEVTFNVTIN
jgi:hypothetical protein